MGIRDILMLIVGYACVSLALYDAYYGLLAYCWLSFMRPKLARAEAEVNAMTACLLCCE